MQVLQVLQDQGHQPSRQPSSNCLFHAFLCVLHVILGSSPGVPHPGQPLQHGRGPLLQDLPGLQVREPGVDELYLGVGSLEKWRKKGPIRPKSALGKGGSLMSHVASHLVGEEVARR